MKFNIIVACCKNNGIGKNGTIPWSEPKDMQYFKNVTTYVEDKNKCNAVIMGRKTYESLNCKPLKDRVNYVITKKKYDNTMCFSCLDDCLSNINSNVETVFVIGGTMLYEEAIKHDNCICIFLNKILDDYDCDVFFPNISSNMYTLHSKTMLTNNIEKYIYKRI